MHALSALMLAAGLGSSHPVTFFPGSSGTGHPGSKVPHWKRKAKNRRQNKAAKVARRNNRS